MSTPPAPAAPESERAILGCVMLNNGLLTDVAGVVDVDHFFGDGNRAIYRAMLDLAIADEPIDASTVGEALGDDLEQCGGHSYLIGISDGLPRPSSKFVVRHGEIVKQKAVSRRIATGAQAMVTAALNGGERLDEYAAEIQAAMQELGGAPAEKFEALDEGRYRLSARGVVFDADYVRRERGVLVGELTVSLGGRVISASDFNLSSARVRSAHAKHLNDRAGTRNCDFASMLETLCQNVITAEREGQPAVILSDLARPVADEALDVDGLPVLARHPLILFGDGGAAKSYLALHIGGTMAKRGKRIGFFDWELAGEDHRDRLERLFGPDMPRIHYARCTRPLVYEADRLRRIVRDEQLDYCIFDSVAFACDGPPEAAEVAGRYFQALRQLGQVGSLHVAHVTKQFEGGDQKPFGSVFWANGARSTWNVKLAETSPDESVITIGLYNRKANLGPRRSAVCFEFGFSRDVTRVRRVDIASVEGLAAKLSLPQRIHLFLQHGARTREQIATEFLDEKDATVRQAISRGLRTNRLVELPGNLIGLHGEGRS